MSVTQRPLPQACTLALLTGEGSQEASITLDFPASKTISQASVYDFPKLWHSVRRAVNGQI